MTSLQVDQQHDGNEAADSAGEGYHRALGARQIQMIAIGGAIGTGLFGIVAGAMIGAAVGSLFGPGGTLAGAVVGGVVGGLVGLAAGLTYSDFYQRFIDFHPAEWAALEFAHFP